MNIEFKVIDRTNYNECIELKTSEEQKRFVASNIFSLVQSAYEPNLYPLGVYKNNKMVGFILYDFDDEINGWSMSRFMIDEKFQNQGIGKVAIEKFIVFFMALLDYIVDIIYKIRLPMMDSLILLSLLSNFKYGLYTVFLFFIN